MIPLPLCHSRQSPSESEAKGSRIDEVVNPKLISTYVEREQSPPSSHIVEHESMAGPEAKSGSSARSSAPNSLRCFCPPLPPRRGCQSFDHRRARPSGTATRSRHSGCRRPLCRQYGTHAVPAPKPTVHTCVSAGQPRSGYGWTETGVPGTYPVPTTHVPAQRSQAPRKLRRSLARLLMICS